MIQKLYKIAYTTGTMFLILSVLLSFVPALKVSAQTGAGAIWTTTSGCGSPQNDNIYVVGANIYIHYQNFQDGASFVWDITGVSGPDKNITVASGTGTISYDYPGPEGCFYAYTIQPGDSGEYKATLDPAVGNKKTDNYRVTDTVIAVSVNKSANPTTVFASGELVTFTVSVTNTSDVTADLTILNDNIYGDLNGQGTCSVPQTLASGATYTCSFTDTISGAAGGSHTNTVTATIDASGATASASDSATVNIVADPVLGVTVNKTANPTSIMEPGGDVIFSVSVTNTSNVTVQLTDLTDDIYGDLNGQGTCATPQSMAAGGVYNCSFTGAVSGASGDSHTDTVTAIINYNGDTDSAQDSATVNIVLQPVLGVTVTKSANPTTVVEPGGDVTFSVLVLNTSNVDVTLNSLTDDLFGDLNGQGDCLTGGTIVVGGSYSCQFPATISGDPGFVHTNTVTAEIGYQTLTDTDSDSATVTVVARANPTISVVKTADPTVLDEPGGQVTYNVVMTNTSAFPVTITSIADNRFGSNPGTCAVGDTIAAGATYSCSFTENITGDANTPHVNTITITVIDDLGKSANGSDDATVTFTPLPTISVSKSANPTSISEYGANVTFTVTVNNTSGEALILNSLNDSVFGNLNGKGTCTLPAALSIGGSYTCSFSQILIGEPSSPHTNTVTAIAVDGDQNQATANDNATVNFQDELPTIIVTKTADPTSVDEPGGLVNFTFQVQNTSGEAVTLDSLNDDVFGNLAGQGDCAVGGSIAAGGIYSCTISQTINGAAGDVHTNTVTAVASDNDGNNTNDSDTAQVNITNVPSSLQVTKSADPVVVPEPGGDVTFTVQVDNLTAEDLTLTSLVDDQYGDLSGLGTCATLPIVIVGNDSYSCEFTGAVSGSAGFIHINTVTATGHGNDNIDISDQDSARVDVTDVVPTIQLTKTADPATLPAPNGTVTYSVAIENQSQEDVTLTSLVDDVFGDLNGMGTCQTGGTILAGDTYTCSFDQTISGLSGDTHTNTITGIVVDNQQNPAESSDSETVTFTDAPELVLVDPCTVGCNLDNVTGEICNTDPVNDYIGAIEWAAFVDTTQIGSGSLDGVPADTCVNLSSARSGDGLYSITVNLVDENRTLDTSCGPLVCTEPNPNPTPTPVPQVNPPTGTSTDVFIPVTGVDLGSSSLVQKLQNFGFALFSIGLVLHGFSLQEKKQDKKEKKSGK